MSRKVE
jgi:hypothetical protein